MDCMITARCITARPRREIHSGLLLLAQHNSAVDHQRGDP